MQTRKRFFVVGGVVGIAALLGGIGPGAVYSQETKSLEPKDGLVCLLVNRNSGRCLSVAGRAAEVGAKIVQGPTPDLAGPSEHWRLVAAGKAFRLRNENSGLVVHIRSGVIQQGAQPYLAPDEVTQEHQHFAFEPVDDSYLLRAGHSQLVLGVAEGQLKEDARVIQWRYVPDVLNQLWDPRSTTAGAQKIAPKEYAQAYFQSLKGIDGKPPGLQMVAAENAEFMRFEPTGLRITLPAGFADRHHAGLRTDFGVKGDFEITLSFEILQEPAIEDTGKSTRVSLEATKDMEPPGWELTIFSRNVGEKVGPSFATWFRTKNREQAYLNSNKTRAKVGRLRMVRSGAELVYLRTEGGDENFRPLRKYPFGTEDLRTVSIQAVTGGARAALDVRLSDFRIRADALPTAPPSEVVAAVPQNVAAPDDANSWLLAALAGGVGIAVVLAIALGAWLFVRSRRNAGSAGVATSVSFPCPGCARPLKTTAEMAGKKVKCAQCGTAVLVPSLTRST